MVNNQHTEATRKKLREADFFLRRLATVPKFSGLSPEPDADQFYLSAFLSAARAIPLALKKERAADWNAWSHEHWFVPMSEGDGRLWDFLVEQRNKVHKEGGPDLTLTVTPISLMEFMRDAHATGASVFMNTGPPGTPQPTFTTVVTSLTAHPGQTLAQACQPLLDLMIRMVDQFERAHPPPPSDPS